MTRKALILSLPIAFLLLLIPVKSSRSLVSTPPEETIKCCIPVQDAEFHRALVEKYAEDIGIDVSFVLARGTFILDSLRNGSMDLVVIQDPEDSLLDGISTSRSFADGSMWCVREDEVEAIQHINRWITELTASERFNRMQKRYFSGKTVSLGSISKYDNLLKASADSIGWDWRLLAAVVYHESRFHIDASSSKGAIGLMQIRSQRYPMEYLLNPAGNISVGSRYLKRLETMYSDTAANQIEAIKFALAGYNVGENKVLLMIKATEEEGEDFSRWDVVKQKLPEGHHTRSYVENVLNTYAYYSKVYPR